MMNTRKNFIYLLIAFFISTALSLPATTANKRNITTLDYDNFFNATGDSNAVIDIVQDRKTKIKIINIPKGIRFLKLDNGKFKRVNRNRATRLNIKAREESGPRFIKLESYKSKRKAPIDTKYGKISVLSSETCFEEAVNEVCGDLVFDNGILEPVTITRIYNNQCSLERAIATPSESNACLDAPNPNGTITVIRVLRGSGNVFVPAGVFGVNVRNNGPSDVEIIGATPRMSPGMTWNTVGNRVYKYFVFGDDPARVIFTYQAN